MSGRCVVRNRSNPYSVDPAARKSTAPLPVTRLLLLALCAPTSHEKSRVVIGRTLSASSQPMLRSEAAFAHLCGVAPVPASSGKITRHRLDRGGNREANWALYLVVVVRLRWHQPTRDYLARRTREGLSKPEIIRCLKRYVAREVFAALHAPTAPANAT